MPELTASTREAARRLGVSDTAIHKAERAGRIAREPDGQWDIDKTRRRLGDKGYDTDDIRHADWSRGTLSMIPTKSSRKVQFTVDHALYSLRNRIERYFNKIKNARRVATPYDKLAASFVAFVEITSIRYWLRLVDRTQSIFKPSGHAWPENALGG